MTTLESKICEALKARIIASIASGKKGEITITMKYDGEEVDIVPVMFGERFETIEYFLVYDRKRALSGGSTLEKVAAELSKYKERVAFVEDDKKKLHDFFIAHIEGRAWGDIDPSDLDFYSDWHKDAYGYRPRNTRTCPAGY